MHLLVEFLSIYMNVDWIIFTVIIREKKNVLHQNT